MTRLKGRFLTGVSCASPGFCMAVGYYPASTHFQTLTEKWNGSSWSLVGSPNTGAPYGNFLNAVSCASPAFCMAVGYQDNGHTDQTLTEKWNGSSWSLVGSPNPGRIQSDGLDGVSCVSATFCMAAGSYSSNGGPGRTLTEKWDGTMWSLASSPNASTHGSFLLGVSCISAAFCMAAGAYNSRHGQPLTEKWDGTRWSLVSSPNPGGIQNSFLGGVSCTSPVFCMAGGATPDRAVTETWNGTGWIQLNSASSTTLPALLGVSCASPKFCMAAGYQFRGAHDQTVTETWNGASWSLLSTPSTSSSQHNTLYAASCASATFCMAVGAYSPNGTSVHTLTASWNGTRWKLVQSLNR